jgi:hypothetical protein
MQLKLLPLLEIQRELHLLPRGKERFKSYIQTITGGKDEIQIPLVGMNPMGKEHVAALIDELMTWGAESLTQEILEGLAPDLSFLSYELQLGLVLTDDLKGGWTNTYLSDYAQRFENDYDLKHGWALVPIWTRQAWSKENLSREVQKTLYRTLYKLRHGLPETLAEMLMQEGLVSVFAEETLKLEPELLDYSEDVISPHLASAHKPICVACLYGDEAASSVGYPVLGLPEMAGFALGFHWARDHEPLEALEP